MTFLAPEMSSPSENLIFLQGYATFFFFLNRLLIFTVSSRIGITCLLVLNMPWGEVKHL